MLKRAWNAGTYSAPSKLSSGPSFIQFGPMEDEGQSRDRRRPGRYEDRDLRDLSYSVGERVTAHATAFDADSSDEDGNLWSDGWIAAGNPAILTGTVVKVLGDGKYLCEFDGDEEAYTLYAHNLKKSGSVIPSDSVIGKKRGSRGLVPIHLFP